MQELQNISFKKSDGKLKELFSKKAEAIAKKLNDGSNKKDISTTQFRKFYDKVLELTQKGENLEQKDFEIEVLPFLKMLKSKVAYAKTRKTCGDNFVKLMNTSIDKVNSIEELKNFKYFLESIIGFMPKN
jgi:CRISPR-associated protein Csm2